MFPEGSLASSVITTVWVGVWVMAVLNLRLGWVLSGLVTPGYLVPLLLVKPVSALVTVGEGVVTYLLVQAFSRLPACWSPHLGTWSALFGRDRFFGLLLASVAVRLMGDSWLLPLLGDWLEQRHGIFFDHRNHLHGFGLIVVALIANQLWKPGLGRGLLMLATAVSATWLIVRYGLMPFTNFSVGSLAYMYEDFADSMLASPKAYLVLITTAFVASRMNLRYAWDFGGILVPALIALQWFEPWRIVATFGEALLIAALAALTLRAPVFAGVTMEGARKLLLFFNVAFAWKLLLGHALVWLAPGQRAVDYFGFGYLLSTLIALKMHDKGLFLRLPSASLQVSLASVVFATLLGFGLTLLPGRAPEAAARAPVAAAEVEPQARLEDLLRDDKLRFQAAREPARLVRPGAAELAAFGAGLRALRERAAAFADPAVALAQARLAFGAAGYTLAQVEGRHWYLREVDPQRGWGSYVLDPAAPHRLAVLVPRPLDEGRTLEAGVALYCRLGAAALGLAGAPARAPQGLDVLAAGPSIYRTFQREVAGNDVLVVRGAGLGEALMPPATLWVGGELPGHLDLAGLRQQLDMEVTLTWQAPQGLASAAAGGPEGQAELWLSDAGAHALAAPAASAAPAIEAHVLDWLRQREQDALLGGPPAPGAAPDVAGATDLAHLLFFDREVLVPLLQVAAAGDPQHGWTGRELLQRLQVIDHSARALGYGVQRLQPPQGGRSLLALAALRPQQRERGTYLLAAGRGGGHSVDVPYPAAELNALEYGAWLFQHLEGRALLIGGRGPGPAAPVGGAPLAQRLHELAAQVLLREAAGAAHMLVASRGYGLRGALPSGAADALLAQADSDAASRATPLTRRLEEAVRTSGLSLQWVDGSPAAAGLEVDGQPAAQYRRQSPGSEVAALWLSPLARAAFRPAQDERLQSAQLLALGIPDLKEPLASYLRRRAWAGREHDEARRALQPLLQAYLQTQDIVALAELQSRFASYRLTRLLDAGVPGGAALLVEVPDGRLVLVANLAPASAAEQPLGERWSPAALQRFIDARLAFLVPAGAAP